MITETKENVMHTSLIPTKGMTKEIHILIAHTKNEKITQNITKQKQ